MGGAFCAIGGQAPQPIRQVVAPGFYRVKWHAAVEDETGKAASAHVSEDESEIQTSEPEPHRETVDLAVDAAWNPVRTRIRTGSHEALLVADGDRLRGVRDGEPVDLPFGRKVHFDYASPAYNAVCMRLDATAEIEVVFLRAVTCEPTIERQRYELSGNEEVATPPAGSWRAGGDTRRFRAAGAATFGLPATSSLPTKEPSRLKGTSRSDRRATAPLNPPLAHPAPQVKDPSQARRMVTVPAAGEMRVSCPSAHLTR